MTTSAIAVDLQQPSLRTREAALLALLEGEPSLEEALPLLLSNSFTEKSWVSSLVEACCELIDEHCRGREERLVQVMECMAIEHARVKSLRKSILIGRILSEGKVFVGIAVRATESLADYQILKQLYLSVLEYMLMSHAATYGRFQMKALQLFRPSLSTFFDSSNLTSLSVSHLAVVSRLYLVSNYTSDEFRSFLIEEYIKKAISSKTPLARGVLEAFGPFVSTLSQLEYERHLEGPLTRAVKKSPEAASRLVATGRILSQALILDMFS